MKWPETECWIWVKFSADGNWVPARFTLDSSYPIEIVGSDEIYRLDRFDDWAPLMRGDSYREMNPS